MLVYNSMFNICRENSFSIPHLFPSLCKIWLEVSKSSKKWQYCRKHEISQVFETLISQILIREDNKWSSYQQCTCQDATFDIWQVFFSHLNFQLRKVEWGPSGRQNSQVNILQKSITFARDRANFCQQNFGENFDKNINFIRNCYLYIWVTSISIK